MFPPFLFPSFSPWQRRKGGGDRKRILKNDCIKPRNLWEGGGLKRAAIPTYLTYPTTDEGRREVGPLPPPPFLFPEEKGAALPEEKEEEDAKDILPPPLHPELEKRRGPGREDKFLCVQERRVSKFRKREKEECCLAI